MEPSKSKKKFYSCETFADYDQISYKLAFDLIVKEFS